MTMLKKQFFLLAGMLLIIASCKDPDSIVGLNIQPTSDKLGLSIDTVTIQTETVLDTNLRSDKVLNLLGSDYDAVFGKTNASVYTQVTLGSTPTFGQSTDTLLSDSLVLRLIYSGFYGDTTTQLTVRVYRMTESMNVDSPYYTNTVFAYDNTELAAYTFTPGPTTKFSEFGTTVPAQLRIPLAKSLADEILSKNGQTELSTNDEWVKYFKGLYIRVDQVTSQGGSICYFNLAKLESKMTLYFHRGTIGDDSLHYDFQFTGTRANHQEHDYTGFPAGTQLNDTTVAVNYIQGTAGLKVKILMPYINQFASKSDIAVNRAELIISKTGTDTIAPPTSLWLQTIDENGEPDYIIDQFESGSYYGGKFSTAKKEYSFNLTHYFQNVITGKTIDHGLLLGVSGAKLLEYFGVILANRVTVGSANASADAATKMKLKLYYTRLSQ